MCIQTGHIVWVNGPFPCGAWPDIKIFRSALKYQLPAGEKVEADAGYRGENQCIRTPHNFFSRADIRAKATARARHETVNGLMCEWEVINQRFRHDLTKHRECFYAVSVMTQLRFDGGECPFQVRY